MSTLKLGNSLHRVVRRCETVCEAACCGLDAFDFHPAHVASAVLTFSDRGPSQVMESVEHDLEDLERMVENESLDEFGELGWCDVLNTSFTPETLSQWISTIRICLLSARQLLALSESLGYDSNKHGRS